MNTCFWSISDPGKTHKGKTSVEENFIANIRELIMALNDRGTYLSPLKLCQPLGDCISLEIRATCSVINALKLMPQTELSSIKSHASDQFPLLRKMSHWTDNLTLKLHTQTASEKLAEMKNLLRCHLHHFEIHAETLSQLLGLCAGTSK